MGDFRFGTLGSDSDFPWFLPLAVQGPLEPCKGFFVILRVENTELLSFFHQFSFVGGGWVGFKSIICGL